MHPMYHMMNNCNQMNQCPTTNMNNSNCSVEHPCSAIFEHLKCFTQKMMEMLCKEKCDSNNVCYETLQAKINFWQENFNKFYCEFVKKAEKS
jgi:hypothetical protein